MAREQRLPRSFYLQETVAVARSLLGCVLHRKVRNTTYSGVIVETEAYLGANDMASHVRGGHRSPRNESMYLQGGHAYVYFTYGMHHCCNVVTQEEGVAEAVLIRAVEPVAGTKRMWSNRPKAKREFDLTNGPGKLCMAMEIDRRLNGESLDGERLWLSSRTADLQDDQIAISRRIGIDGAGEEAAAWPLRFSIRSNPYVSR